MQGGGGGGGVVGEERIRRGADRRKRVWSIVVCCYDAGKLRSRGFVLFDVVMMIWSLICFGMVMGVKGMQCR